MKILAPLLSIFNLLHSTYELLKLQFLSLTMSEQQLHEKQEQGPESSVRGPKDFDPLIPSTPISYPIKTLEALASRSYFSSFHYPFNKASVPLLQSDSANLPDRRRVLVCHDMQGGYVDDKWIQGGNNAEAYSIWHWHLMDVFVYFSHNLVTLPPPSWINAAHRHGVRVLGTFITEWDEGRLTCDQLLSSKESAAMYAERLKELAIKLGFDGWLINMEVKLHKGQIPNMMYFVSHLTQIMHSSLPGSLVIWYDSVTIDGHLRWQDQLNGNNRPFFDICDGIFMNYTWKENYPRLSAAVAGNRKYDVYMGIDVFGRGAYGGGQWNTHIALDLLKKEDVSVAIFAPGWVYETKQLPDFHTAQNHWWALVEKSWGACQAYPKFLPFYSNFDQGCGYHYSVEGESISDASWCNISSQNFQPCLDHTRDGTAETIEVSVDLKGASYSGGGNITFRGTLEDDVYFTTRLFQGEILLANSPLYFTYSVKSEENSNSSVGLLLEFTCTANNQTALLLSSSENVLDSMNQFSSKFDKVIAPNHVTKAKSSEWIVIQSSIVMDGYTLRGIHAVCYRPLKKTRSDSESKFHAVLGHISITTPDSSSYIPPSSSWRVDGQYTEWTSSSSEGTKYLSTLIKWELEDGNNDDHSLHFNVHVEKIGHSKVEREFLGIARVRRFYVSDMVVPSGISGLRFIVQVSADDGTCMKLEESPSYLLRT